MAKPKVAALWCGGIMSATEARQMEMQEKAPREACRDTAQLTRHQVLSLRQLLYKTHAGPACPSQADDAAYELTDKH